MTLLSTRTGYRMLALSAALALPGLAVAQQAPADALSYFAARAKAQGLTAADVANPLVTSSYFDATMGLTHTYLLQRVNGVPVFGATGDVHTDRSGKAVSSYQAFVANAAATAPSAKPTLSAADAVTAAAAALGLPRPVGLEVTDDATSSPDIIMFNKGGISDFDIPVQLMYARTATGLALVWNVTIAQHDQQHQWNARVDAHTGRLVDKNDYTVSEQASFTEFGQRKQSKHQALAFNEAATATTSALSPTSTTAANSVTVIPFPLESPGQGNRAVVAMPSVGNQYSPYGWAAGQAPTGTFADSYSFLSTGKYLTRGNNVAAYDDYSNTTNGTGTANFNSSTSSPDGGSTMSYDYPFVQANGPRANLNPAITNLFYANNIMHDVMMSHGFSEAAGNFQNKNTTQSGGGNDQVLAEAQDAGSTMSATYRNNANFSTPVDGSPGRMQMYLWDNKIKSLTITSPASIAGTYAISTNVDFGTPLSSIAGGVCGDIVPVNDGSGVAGGIQGCGSNYVNGGAVNGNIALIRRRGCTIAANNTFIAKVKNAQNNGATMVIIYNNTASDTLFGMTGVDPTITIPAIFITGNDGLKIRNALTGSSVAVGCAKEETGADLDGSFDNGVMSHEYGHGISNRLTGGPANSSCVTLTNGIPYGQPGSVTYQCAGEGWSDFFALWMTTKATDYGNTKRFMGTYVVGQPSATGPGIRSYPYSINMGVNPLTYGRLTTTAYQETHALGEVWTSVLWDLNWQFIAKYGFNTDFYAATGGNNMCLKLILDGCKIQACNPSFLQSRNAILKADSLANLPASPNRALIWTVFARRGMGYSATGGTRANNLPLLNVTEAFDMPPGLTAVTLATKGASTNSALEAYPNPAENRLTVRTQLNSAAPVQVTLLDMLGKTVLAPVAVPAAQMQQNGTELDISQLANGIYIVRVATTEGTYTTKVTVQH